MSDNTIRALLHTILRGTDDAYDQFHFYCDSQKFTEMKVGTVNYIKTILHSMFRVTNRGDDTAHATQLDKMVSDVQELLGNKDDPMSVIDACKQVVQIKRLEWAIEYVKSRGFKVSNPHRGVE